jgi:hypothetical protein
MPEMKHNFQRGRMNKDLDERIVPDGEYREALNIEVSTSENSDVGSLQTIMGNTIMSQIDLYGNKNFKCIGSIQDSRNNKLYWFITGTGCDAVAEYDYITGLVSPVCVDVHVGTNRVLNFSEDFLITGLNIMDGVLYWTDNNSEPKKINIERCKAGTVAFNVHTIFKVKDVSPNAIPTGPGSWVNYNLTSTTDLVEEHLTIIKKGPPAAPVLEMIDTIRGDEDGDGVIGGGEISGTLASASDFIDPNTLDPIEFLSNIQIQTTHGMDWMVGDWVIIYSDDDPSDYIRAQISAQINFGTWEIENLTGNQELHGQDDLKIKLEDIDPLFKFKFPRFAYRYKYEDGEYSCFSPFTEVAFIPGKFNYMCKEGYNLGMVNNLRKLAIKDFVYSSIIPQDVIAIDILYKESNSPNIYSVKQVKRRKEEAKKWDSWNGISSSATANDNWTKGYLPLTSEMIHAVLPANQLLRPWDNVPRKALAQEIIGNRLVYGNYLQNYNLENKYVNPAENNIKVDLKLSYHSRELGHKWPEETPTPWSVPQRYSPAKSVKTLRTYQVGVVYLDKYGRETPVLSEDNRGGQIVSQASIYIPKEVADKKNSLIVQTLSNPPDWATHYKYFIKETSNEYYNMAMDRWYDAEDGNIWLSFPSAERNKIDEESFLILKKEHDNSVFIKEKARYKVIAIENEAPRFIKLQHISMGGLTDYTFSVASGSSTIDVTALGAGNISTFPYTGGVQIYVYVTAFESAGWGNSLRDQDISQVYMRIKTGTAISQYYRLKQVSWDAGTNCFILTSAKVFGPDMGITSPNGTFAQRITNCELQIVKRIPEDRAEFEGRFFAKILKDKTIIDALGTSGTNIELYMTKAQMLVQYINPMNPHNFSDPGDWYNQSQWKLSVDERNASSDWHCKQGGGGDGVEYWKNASRHDGTPYESTSTGWFIDASEGFVPFNNTMRMFNDDPSKRFNAATNPWNYANCWFGGGTGRIDYQGDPTTKMLKVLGVNTYGQNHSNTDYLNLNNVRPPVRTSNINTIEDAPVPDGGGKSPAKGIDGNYIYLSYSGLNNEGGSTGAGPTSWSSLHFDFNADAIRHQNDILFIEKLRQPGAIWQWKEDPGEVMYMTKQNTLYPDEVTDTVDGLPGIAMYNYVNFVDYWTSHRHHRECVESDGWPNWLCDGSCSDDKDTLVSRGKKSGWINGGWIQSLSSTSGCWSTHFPNCWEEHCLAGLSISNHCPETHNDHVRVSSGGYTNGKLNSHQVWPVGVYDWDRSYNMRRRFILRAVPLDSSGNEDLDALGNNKVIGGVGPHFYKPTNNPLNDAHFDGSLTPILTNPVTAYTYDGENIEADRAPGIRPDGMHTGYTHNQFSWYYDSTNQNQWNDIPQYRAFDNHPTDASKLQKPPPGSVTWLIKEYFVQDAEDNSFSSTNPAIWETEPKEDVGLDIYYEVGQIYPIELNASTTEQQVGPVGPDIRKNSTVLSSGGGLMANGISDIRVLNVGDSKVRLGVWDGTIGGVVVLGANTGDIVPSIGDILHFERADGSRTQALVTDPPTAINGFWVSLNSQAHGAPIEVPWFNCYSYGNGVESDRIRDDYNQVTIDNGPKASTTLEETYLEERRCTGFIWSGIYNSNSGINNLNQFIQAEAITKDVNPGYGCIQKMHTRDNDLVAFCEDRVLKVYANKDALYNADGNINVVATNKVLGAVKPFVGDYGISKNPESFASDSYRSYFSDASRGAVLRLSQDGITPISDAGMKDWFADVLPEYAKVDDNNIIGSFDDKKQEYNITLIAADYVSPCDTGGNGSGGNGSGGNGYIAANALGDWNFATPGEDGQSYPLSWTQFDNSGNFVNIAVDTVVSIVIAPVDMTSTNQSSEFADMIDALNTYGAGNILLHYTDSALGSAGYGSGSVVTYEIVSITINGYGNYVITVVHESGTYIHMAATHFWWSLKSEGDDVNGASSNNDTIIQNIEDEIHYTLAYSETSKGWTSFRSYLQESGVSLNNEYYTFKNGELYSHHTNEDRNNFYGNQYDSYVSILLNRGPSIIKSFTTVGYEGSLARITQDKNNPDYYDNTSKDGWYVGNMVTNLQEVGNLEFMAKEEKYFSQIRGVKTIWTEDGLAGNIDPKEFSFQGIGNNDTVTCPHCGPTISWNCAGSPCECIMVAGSGGNYPTQLACENDTSTCCGSNESWCFVGDECIDPGDSSGEYSDLCDCILDNYPCNQGYQWIVDCLGLTIPTTFVTGCMDDGTTTDPFITQNRPSGWIGPASNYDINATIPDCSCIYQTLPTYDCNNGSCDENLTGNGQYTGINALNDCIANCTDPCVHQDFSVDFNIVDPTEIEPPCALVASDGSISTIVTNANPGSANPFTSWTVEYYDSIIPTTGPPTIGGLIYSDPNTYGLGVWSNTYVGLTTAQAGTTGYGIYFVIITDNNGCEYGPFSVRINCLGSLEDPCEDYPGDYLGNCCNKCPEPPASWGACTAFCQQWEDCCDPGSVGSFGSCQADSLGGWINGTTYSIGNVVQYVNNYYFATSNINPSLPPIDPNSGWDPCFSCDTAALNMVNLNPYWPMVSGIGFGDEFCCRWDEAWPGLKVYETNPSCAGGDDGEIKVYVISGFASGFPGIAMQQGNWQPNAFVIWRDASGNQIGDGASTTILSGNDTLYDLPAGTYYAEVWNCDSYDASAFATSTPYYGCTRPGCSQTVEFTLTDPLSFNISGVTTPAGSGGSMNGAINLTVSGGVAPYTYSWANHINSWQSTYSASTQNISGLGVGPYYVTVTDASGCTSTANWFILPN